MLIIQNGYENPKRLEIFARQFFTSDDDALIFTDCRELNGKINAYTQINYGTQSYFNDLFFELEPEDFSKLDRVKEAVIARSFIGAARQIKNIEFPWGALSGIRPAKLIRTLCSEGKNIVGAKEYLKRVYAVTEEKAELASTVAENERKILSEIDTDAVSLYIGIPFCPTRCLYCSFVSTDIRISGKYMNEFVYLLLKEIEKTAEVVKRLGKLVQTIYIGGGTPTTLSVADLAAVCDKLGECFDLSHLKEFTLEAGRPDTVTPERLSAAKAGGVTRISVNPQTMNADTLRVIGRNHTPEMIYSAFDAARAAGFDNINMDLIAGLPGESAEDFQASLDKVIALDPENITVHTMCVKHSARLRHSSAELTTADEVRKMLSYTQARMNERGYEPYYMYRQKNILGNLENVGYAKPDCMGIYNIGIMEEIQTILALGGGGSTKLVEDGRIKRIFNFKDPAEYIRRFDEIIKRKEQTIEFFTK